MKNDQSKISIKNTKLRIAVSIFIIVGLFLFVSELMSSFYNVLLDERNATVWERILFSFKPTVVGIFIGSTIIIILLAFMLLRPLFNYVRKGTEYEKARKALANIPWWMILVQIVFWIIGTTVYFMMQDWNAESGIPYGWVLSIKNSTGLMGSIYTALYIHHLTGEIKKKLNIISINEDENDFFVSHIHSINVFAIIIYLTVNLGYVAFYSYNTPVGYYSEFVFNIRFIVAGVIYGLLSVGLVFITRQVVNYQTDFLEKKLREFSSKDQADLTDRILIINYDKIGRLSHLFNRFMERLHEDMVAVKNLVKVLNNESDKIAGASEGISKITNQQADDTENISGMMNQYTDDMQKVRLHVDDQSQIVQLNSEQSQKLMEGLQSIIDFSGEVKKTTGDNLEVVRQNVTKVEESVNSTLHVNDKIKNIAKKIEVANQYTSNIDEILHTIEDIADQTNMLSMNASIEAAHAGSAGTGFAIVAQEIRELANISADSVRSISDIMEKIKDSVSQSVQLAEDTLTEATSGSQIAREAGQSIQTIGDKMRNSMDMIGEVNRIASDQGKLIRNFSDKMEELIGISEDIRNSIDHQAQSARNIETSLNSISDSFDESAKLSGQLKEMSEEMKNMNLKLQDLSGRFMTSQVSVDSEHLTLK